MFGKKHDSAFKTAMVSATTIPLQGGLYNNVGPVRPVKAESPAVDVAWFGASGIVPMLLAQYIVESSSNKLFHMPSFDIRDVAMMATVKLITPFIFSLAGFVIEEDSTTEQYIFGVNTRIAEDAKKANIKLSSVEK